MREKLPEDLKFIKGEGRYIDDLKMDSLLWLGVVRSQYARAKIKSIDSSAASKKVRLVITSDDIKAVYNNAISGLINPEAKTAKLPVLAEDVVNFVGQPVLAFVAENRYDLEDLGELFAIDYEPLEPVLNPEKAMEPSSEIIHPRLGTNVSYSAILGGKQALIESAFTNSENVVVEDTLSTHRLVPSAIETRGAAVNWDGNRYTIHVSSQGVFNMRESFKDTLKAPDDKQVHIIQADTGGAFGSKSALYPEYVLACYASMRLGRPIKWIETRSENFVATQHGRDARAKISLAANKHTGEIVALKGNVIGDLGAYAFSVSSRYAAFVGSQLTGPYRIPQASVNIANVYTNKTPLGPYRGAGRPEAAFFYERMIDLLADELHMDEVELRRRNLIRLEEMPYTSPTGMLLDSENYSAILDKSLAFFDYTSQKYSLETEGTGIGLTDYIELSRSMPGESALIKLERDGSFTVFSGLGGQGQGHATMLGNLLSQELGVPKERIRITFGDSDLLRGGVGTFGSRSAVAGGNAAIRAARELQKKMVDSTAVILGGNADAYYYSEGSMKMKSDPAFKLDLKELASRSGPAPLLAAGFYEIKDTSSFGVHSAMVDVDIETGKVKIVKYMAGDDAGRIIDETSAEGQIAGGLQQGVGEVFYEQMVYDESGQPVVGTFADYPIPEATEGVAPKSILFEFPSSLVHGVRGIGEAGAIAAAPTLARAVELSIRRQRKRGVRIRSTLLSPEEVLKLVAF